MQLRSIGILVLLRDGLESGGRYLYDPSAPFEKPQLFGLWGGHGRKAETYRNYRKDWSLRLNLTSRGKLTSMPDIHSILFRLDWR